MTVLNRRITIGQRGTSNSTRATSCPWIGAGANPKTSAISAVWTVAFVLAAAVHGAVRVAAVNCGDSASGEEEGKHG